MGFFLGLIIIICILTIIFVPKIRIPRKEELDELNKIIKEKNIDKNFLPKNFDLKLEFIKDFPQEYKDILKESFHLYNLLPKDIRQQLHGHINVFLNLKDFHGHKGLEVTTEMKVTIAAQACMLLLNRQSNYFPRLQTIEMYPQAFSSEVATGNGTLKQQVRTGESWSNGRVILSWSHSKQGISNFKDGSNVVMHEFAHRLDQLDNNTDGIPTKHFGNGETYYLRSEVILKEYQKHLKRLKKSHKKNNKTLLTEYAGTNEAEFFAVATEFFFEKGRQLKKSEPKLYDLLKDFYKLDTSSWNFR